jgi:hypothetical protein
VQPAPCGTPQGPPAALRRPGPKKPKGPVVKFTCGHARPADHLARGRCPACQELGRQQMREEHHRVLERRREAAQADRVARPRFRLLDGSDFHATYHAEGERWSGTLAVPGLGPVSGEADTVLRLIDRLGHLAHAAARSAAEGEEKGKEGQS